jgi:hypothetical protein
MGTLLATYRVNDYGTFKAEFDEFAWTRKELGATGHRLMRAPDNPGIVAVVIDFSSLDAARRFAADPGRLDVLDRAGVIERTDLILQDMDTEVY